VQTRAFRARAVAVIWPALASGAVLADGVTVCSPRLPDTELRAGLALSRSASLGDSTDSVAPRRTLLAIDWRVSGRWSTGIAHRYTDLNVNGLPVQGNGHLHTVWLPVRHQWAIGGSHLTFALAPAVSATSNAMRRPGHWSSDDLQLLAAVVWSRPLGSESALHAGLCRDYRSGSAAIYPLLRYDGRVDRWQYRVGYPESSLIRLLSDRIDAGIGVAPAGNQWRAHARDLQASSPLEHKAWLAAVHLNWRPLERATVSVSAGREFDNRWRFTLADGTRVELRSEATVRAGIQVRWRF
jgi:hypothetical protein